MEFAPHLPSPACRPFLRRQNQPEGRDSVWHMAEAVFRFSLHRGEWFAATGLLQATFPNRTDHGDYVRTLNRSFHDRNL